MLKSVLTEEVEGGLGMDTSFYPQDAWLTYYCLTPDEAIGFLARYFDSKPRQVIVGFRVGELLLERGKRVDAIVTWRKFLS